MKLFVACYLQISGEVEISIGFIVLVFSFFVLMSAFLIHFLTKNKEILFKYEMFNYCGRLVQNTKIRLIKNPWDLYFFSYLIYPSFIMRRLFMILIAIMIGNEIVALQIALVWNLLSVCVMIET
jgi:hypothetical protein